MPANTPKGFPYVLPADNVADYPATSQGLAVKLDAAVPFAIAAGVATINMNGNTSGTAGIAFPAGLFTVPPIVTVTKALQGGGKTIPNVSSITKDGAIAQLVSADGTAYGAGAYPVHWIAIQQTPTAAPG